MDIEWTKQKNNCKVQRFTANDLTHIIFVILFFFVLSTVFVINNHFANGVVSGKYFWFYGSMGLASVATLIYSITNKQSVRFSVTDALVLLFAGSVFLSSCVFNTASANTTKLTLLALLVVLYFCLRVVFQGIAGQARNDKGQVQARNDKVIFVSFFIILTGLVEAVWGLLQLYGFKTSQHGLFRLTGSFFNPGPYAGYLAVVFPLALFELRVKRDELRVKNEKDKKFITLSSYLLTLSSLIAIILVLPAAMSRAAWLAAIAGTVVVVIPRLTRNPMKGIRGLRVKPAMTKAKFKPAMTGMVIILLACSALLGMYYLKKDSADGRMLTWKVSLSVLTKHPFGVGLGHFPSAYGDAQAAYFASGKASETEEYVAGNPEYGFNEFLQIAVESGIVSLLLFIGLLVFAFKGLIKNKHWGVMGSLVALLVFACFSYPFSVLPFPILLVFLLAMSVDGTQITQIRLINADKSFKSALISLICVICVPLILYKQYPVYQAYKQWNNNRIYYNAGMYKEAAQNYEPLYPFLNDQIQFLFEYGRSLAQSEQPEKSNEVLQRAMQISCDPMLYNIMGKNYQAMKEYDFSEENLLKSTQIVPNRLYPYYLLMKLYVETGKMEKARKAAGIVMTKEPKVQSQAVKEMREEAKKIKN